MSSYWFNNLKNINSHNNLSNANNLTLRENFKEFCKNTTFHGLKFVGDGKISWFERIFFGISFITVLSVAAIFIHNVYDQWNSTPVIVSISSATTLINQIPFPAVTICNMNQASAKRIRNITQNSSDYEMLELLCNAENVDLSTVSNLTNWDLYGNFILKTGQPCEDMFVNCRFGKNPSRCSNFFHTILTDEGLCCTFNAVDSSFMYSEANKTTSKDFLSGEAVPVDWNLEQGYSDILPKSFYPRIGAVRGLAEGLFLILDAQINDYYCSSTNGAGFKIAVHSPIETPNLKEIGLVIPVGTQSRIRITPQITDASENIKGLPIRDRQCLFQSENFLKTFSLYSQHNCEIESYANILIDKCHCIPYYLTQIQPNIRVCGIKDIMCLENNSKKTNQSDFLSKDSKRNCYQSCFHLSYSTSLFVSYINGSGKYDIKDSIIQRMKNDYYANNTVVLQFFYQYNAFRSSHKTQYIGTTEFLSNTGGLMGLFLGFSFISIVEVFYYGSFRPCCAQCKYKKAIKKSEINDRIKVQERKQNNHWKKLHSKIGNKIDNSKNSYNIHYFE